MRKRPVKKRRDYYCGPFHLIVRGYNAAPQWGWLLWGKQQRTTTLDIWVRRTLVTLRWRFR